jgi:hypothetical protein
MIFRRTVSSAALALGLIGLGAAAHAETINVDGLVSNGGGSWTYTTDLTATGAAVDNTDSFTIQGVQGFVSFANNTDHQTFTDHAGNTWDAAAVPQSPGFTSISVTYTPGQSTEFGANLANSFGNLVDIAIKDQFTGRSAGATWSSQDHGVTLASGTPALSGRTEGATGVIDTPAGSAVPLPAAAWGGLALFGLVAGARRRKSA